MGAHLDLWDVSSGHKKAREELERLYEIEAAWEQAPEAVMDTRTSLGVCALKEEDFPVLEALKGKRVKLIVMEP